MCKISIIIPVYNVEKYISECLESLVNQTFKDIEIICVNDASTDNSLNIIQGYCNKYSNIRLIVNDMNRGQSYSRDAGLKEAEGEYVYFLDADDYLELNALEILSDIINQEHLDMISFNSRTIYECESTAHGTVRKRKYADITQGVDSFLLQMEKDTFAGTVWQYLYNRDFLIKNNIQFIGRTNHEDMFYTFLTHMYAEKVKIINDSLHVYRVRAGSLVTGEGQVKLVNGLFICYLAGLQYAMKVLGCSADRALAVKYYLSLIRRLIDKNISTLSFEQKSNCIALLDNDIEKELFRTFSKIEDTNCNISINSGILHKVKEFESVYVYGAGAYGKKVISLFNDFGIGINGVVVTNKESSLKSVYTHKVIEYNEISDKLKNAVIIVAVSDKYKSEIMTILNENKNLKVVLFDEIFNNV